MSEEKDETTMNMLEMCEEVMQELCTVLNTEEIKADNITTWTPNEPLVRWLVRSAFIAGVGWAVHNPPISATAQYMSMIHVIKGEEVK